MKINVGDDNPADNIINSNPAKRTAPLLGDEIPMPTFQRVQASLPVSIELLDVYG